MGKKTNYTGRDVHREMNVTDLGPQVEVIQTFDDRVDSFFTPVTLALRLLRWGVMNGAPGPNGVRKARIDFHGLYDDWQMSE